MTEPTAPDASQAAIVYKNIASLIRNGFFPGAHAEYVKDALGFLDQMASLASGQHVTGSEPLHVVDEPKA